MSRYDLAATGETVWEDSRRDRPSAGSAYQFVMAVDCGMHCFECNENWVLIIHPGVGRLEGRACPSCTSERTYLKEEKFIGYELKG